MADVGTMVVTLNAKTADFNRAITAAQKKSEHLAKAFTKVGSSMTKWVTGPIVGAAAALGGVVLSTMKLSDEILLLSQRSGLSTKAIQELQYAGGLAGVSIDTMVSSTAILTRNLSDAANGIGEAKDTVALLGLEMKDVSGNMLSQEELFTNTVNALSEMKNPTEQAAAAMELFGRGGSQILPLLKTFPGGMSEVSREAEKMGLILSGDTIKAFDKLDDVLSTKLPGAFRGAANAMMEEFLPILQTKIIPFIEGAIIPAIIAMGDHVGKLIKWWDSLSTPMKTVIVTLTGLAAAAGPVLFGIGALLPVFTNIVTVIKMMTPLLTPLIALIGGISAPVWITIGAIAALGAAFVYFGDEIIGGVAKAIDLFVEYGLNNMLKGVNWVTTKLNEAFGLGIPQMELFATAGDTMGARFSGSMHSMKDAISEWVDGMIFAKEPLEEVQAGIEKTGEVAAAAADKIKAPILQLPEAIEEADLAGTMKIAVDPIKELGERTFRNMKGHVDKLGLSFKSFKGTLKAVGAEFKGFFKELLKMAAKKAVLRLIDTLTGGAVSSGGLAGAGMSVLGKVGGFLGFAKGGIVKEPTAMVGLRSGGLGLMAEAGPEAIVPLGGGRSGGGAVSLTVNVYGSVGVEDIGDQLVRTLRMRGI